MLKRFKPYTPGRRFMTVLVRTEVTRDEPYKPLTFGRKRLSGRNNAGRITVWWRGGGHKRRYRVIDFRRYDKVGIPARVESIEYDPNRSANIALVCYADGERRYILHPDGLKVGDIIQTGPDAEIRVGNALPLRYIPEGIPIHNVEFWPGHGGAIARSAGSMAVIMAKEGEYAQVRLPSGEIRRVHLDCYATIGQVGNLDHFNVTLGKAGRSRWLGRRPHVRGTCMNPVDHPHGGGEGKTHPGRHPVTPWGQPTKGYKTRRNKRTQAFIVKRRK
ncbi:50S ribosomal protein L2 [bacterium HR11]|nr:50S ribosomal protein L2 [bacterium HR11]